MGNIQGDNMNPLNHFIKTDRTSHNDKCYRCGGETKYREGALGYEAMKCKKCGHEYSETSSKEYDENKKKFEGQK